MIEATVLKRLRERLVFERQKATDVVCTGKINDLREYGYSCGYIKACDDVEVLIQEIYAEIQEQ